MEIEKMHWFGIGLGVAGVLVTVLVFRESKFLQFFIVLSLLAGVIPFMISFLLGEGRQREKEEKFLAFTRDLVELVRSGTPVSKSITKLHNRNYGTLTPHVGKLANQLSIGLTLTSALKTFAKDTKSRVISRAVGLISEAERAGGNIETILESVADSVNQIENLRQERKAAVSNLVTQGYLIFFVFIIIMLVLEFQILPMVSNIDGSDAVSGLSISVNTLTPDQFSMPLFVMLLVQSFFAGLVIGKISEGTLKSGFKHSFILLTLTLLVTTGAKALFS